MSRRIRTFIAIDPGPAIRQRLVSLQENLAKSGIEVKWVEPDNLHLTLLFLGEVRDTDLLAVCRVVGDHVQNHSIFSMTVEKVGCFPNHRRPRVLWVGVGEGAKEVTAIHDDLENPLMELGCYRKEDRHYTPHLTLGRVKSERPNDLSTTLAKYATWNAGHTMVREILVMGSELSPAGPVYTVLSRAKLTG
jgi:2'-5' RNA ligase